MKKALVLLFVLTFFGCGSNSGPIKIDASDARLSSHSGKKNQSGAIQNDGKAGYFVYGPYMTLSPGKYMLVAKGSLVGKTDNVGYIDAVSLSKKIVMGKKDIMTSEKAGEAIAILEFDLDTEVTDAEFRIILAEGVIGTFSGYELSKVDPASGK